jgi:thymidylate synthase
LKAYLDILRDIAGNGETVTTGAYLPSENRHPYTKTLFAAQFRHDLATGFPAVTTKKLFFESVVKELLWFLRGETNVKTLGCGIWSSWAAKGYDDPARPTTETRGPGDCGRIYGAGWRRWAYSDLEATEGYGQVPVGYFDQIDQVVKDLKAVVANPNARERRRIILTAWNPPDIAKMGLPPCHTLAQFLPLNGVLNTHCFWRSIDWPTGAPFNISSYALLTHILCAVTGLTPGKLVASVTDCHMYDNQTEMVRKQLLRKPYAHPVLIMPNLRELAPDLSIEQVRALSPDMFTLGAYQCHGALRSEVAV